MSTTTNQRTYSRSGMVNDVASRLPCYVFFSLSVDIKNKNKNPNANKLSWVINYDVAKYWNLERVDKRTPRRINTVWKRMNRMNQKKELDYSWNIPRHQHCKSEKHDFHPWDLTSWWLKANAQHVTENSLKKRIPLFRKMGQNILPQCSETRHLTRRAFIFTYILKLKQANSVEWTRINSCSVLVIAYHVLPFISAHRSN